MAEEEPTTEDHREKVNPRWPSESICVDREDVQRNAHTQTKTHTDKKGGIERAVEAEC